MNQYSIVKGKLFHHRFLPTTHSFKHNQILVFMDLEALSNNVKPPWPIVHNKKGLLSLYDSSYLGNKKDSLLNKVRSHFLEYVSECTMSHKYYFLASPNVFGYSFNPASFYFRLHSNGDICSSIVEVNNTFGESRLYTLDSFEEPGPVITGSHHKDFHVSPYISREGTYEFHFSIIDSKIDLRICLIQDEAKVIETVYKAYVHPMTTRSLFLGIWSLFISVFATELRILIQAFNLQYRKKLPFHSKPKPLKGTIPSPKPGFISRLKIPFL